MADKKSTLVQTSDKKLEDSYYADYAPLCDECRCPLDHPPIQLLVDNKLKSQSGDSKKPYVEGTKVMVCRACALEALVPIEEAHESNPKAGWYFRAILNGELEPSGANYIKKENDD